MIAKLRGIVDEIADTTLVVDVQGVGYLVHCSTRTLREAPPPGQPIVLHTEQDVREDAVLLYGFGDRIDREWFRLLTRVQGVGGRVALGLLGAMRPAELAAALMADDRATLTRADGVGPKLAARLVTELREKATRMPVGERPVGDAVGTGSNGAMAAVTLPVGIAGDGAGVAADTVSALVNLGYRRAEAVAAIGKAVAELGSDADMQSLLRAGLRELSP